MKYVFKDFWLPKSTKQKNTKILNFEEHARNMFYDEF